MSAFTKAKAFLKHEFLSVLPPTIYFLVAFNIVVLTTSLLLDKFSVSIAFHASATVLALLIGKVVLIVDKIRFIRRFDRHPLAYPITFKAAAYSTIVFVFRILEHRFLDEDIIWRLFAVSQIWIFVLFLVYFTFSELIAAFGLSRRDLAYMLFRQHPARGTDTT